MPLKTTDIEVSPPPRGDETAPCLPPPPSTQSNTSEFPRRPPCVLLPPPPPVVTQFSIPSYDMATVLSYSVRSGETLAQRGHMGCEVKQGTTMPTNTFSKRKRNSICLSSPVSVGRVTNSSFMSISGICRDPLSSVVCKSSFDVDDASDEHNKVELLPLERLFV